MDEPEQPTLSQLMESQVRTQESWLFLAEFCHKPSLQETIDCLTDSVGEILPKTGVSPSFVEATQTMLSRLMEVCYDLSDETTLNNMRDAFAQVNARSPLAFA